MIGLTKIVAIKWLQQIERVNMNTMFDRICIIPWKFNTAQSMAWGGDKTSGFLLVLGDYQNVWSDLNCGHQLVAAHRTCQDEHNGSSDMFLTLKIEYNTEHSIGRRQDKRVSISLGGLPQRLNWIEVAAISWLQQIERVKMNTIVDRICVLPWKLNTAQSIAYGGDKTSGFLLA